MDDRGLRTLVRFIPVGSHVIPRSSKLNKKIIAQSFLPGRSVKTRRASLSRPSLFREPASRRSEQSSQDAVQTRNKRQICRRAFLRRGRCDLAFPIVCEPSPPPRLEYNRRKGLRVSSCVVFTRCPPRPGVTGERRSHGGAGLAPLSRPAAQPPRTIRVGR
jgi:hypothetical protein